MLCAPLFQYIYTRRASLRPTINRFSPILVDVGQHKGTGSFCSERIYDSPLQFPKVSLNKRQPDCRTCVYGPVVHLVRE